MTGATNGPVSSLSVEVTYKVERTVHFSLPVLGPANGDRAGELAYAEFRRMYPHVTSDDITKVEVNGVEL